MYLPIISFSANCRAANLSTATSVSLSDWLGGQVVYGVIVKVTALIFSIATLSNLMIGVAVAV
jgi:hypothetical protein